MDAPETALSIEKPRIIVPASELATPDCFCTACEKPLKGNVAWLELDQRTDTYHDFGGIPENKSQGWFPFGIDCARSELKKARAAQGKES